jgi:hypothetical protein
MKDLVQFVLLLTVVLTRSQAQAPTESEVWQLCRPPAYAPYADTVAREVTLDSMRLRIAGRWRLAEIGTGWTSPTKPDKVVELVINQQGKGVIYEQGQLVSKVQVRLSRQWDMIRFTIHQEGQSIFHFSSMSKHGGLIHACPMSLVIGNGMADGTAFAFERKR